MTGEFIDPKAPHPPKARPGPADTLPTARMHRLGATGRTMTAIVAWWPDVPVDTRVAIVERWAVTPDVELDIDLGAIDQLFDGTAQALFDWLGRQPERVEAAKLAIVIEHTRPAPRATVLAALNKVVGR